MILADILGSASDSVGGFLPRLAGAIILLVLGLIVVALIRRALLKVLRAAGLDAAGERWGAADALERFGLGRSLAGLLAGAVRVGLLLVVLFSALSLLALAFLSESLAAAILYLPRVLLAFLLLLTGMVVSEFARRHVERLTTPMDIPGPLGELAQAVVLAVFVVTALAQVGVPTQILLVLVSVLLAAAAATLALAFRIGGREMGPRGQRPPLRRRRLSGGRRNHREPRAWNNRHHRGHGDRARDRRGGPRAGLELAPDADVVRLHAPADPVG